MQYASPGLYGTVYPLRAVGTMLGAALAAFLLLAAPVTAAKGKRVVITQTANRPVPDRGGGDLILPITLGKKFKRFRVTDVNLNVNFTSNCSTDPNAANSDCMADLIVMLFAPGAGNRGLALNQGAGGNVITDLTFDDESPNAISNIPPSIEGPEPNRLYPPYVGSVKPDSNWRFDVEDGPMKGRWRLIVRDSLLGDPLPTISTLGSWRLEVRGKRR
jgi:hypothetical protein